MCVRTRLRDTTKCTESSVGQGTGQWNSLSYPHKCSTCKTQPTRATGIYPCVSNLNLSCNVMESHSAISSNLTSGERDGTKMPRTIMIDGMRQTTTTRATSLFPRGSVGSVCGEVTELSAQLTEESCHGLAVDLSDSSPRGGVEKDVLLYRWSTDEVYPSIVRLDRNSRTGTCLGYCEHGATRGLAGQSGVTQKARTAKLVY